jgi:hypothetical protein
LVGSGGVIRWSRLAVIKRRPSLPAPREHAQAAPLSRVRLRFPAACHSWRLVSGVLMQIERNIGGAIGYPKT